MSLLPSSDKCVNILWGAWLFCECLPIVRYSCIQPRHRHRWNFFYTLKLLLCWTKSKNWLHAIHWSSDTSMRAARWGTIRKLRWYQSTWITVAFRRTEGSVKGVQKQNNSLLLLTAKISKELKELKKQITETQENASKIIKSQMQVQLAAQAHKQEGTRRKQPKLPLLLSVRLSTEH